MRIEKPIVYFKSSEYMHEIEDNSIQLIITSPPYGKIKDYGEKNQIGFSDSFESYFLRLKKVWSECYRILEPQCRLVINIGDQYLRASEFGRYRILSIASVIVNDCLSIGFDFLGDIIWQKISTTNTTGGCSLMGSIYYPRNGLLTYDYEHILIFKKYNGKSRKIDLKRKELSKISLSEWKKWFTGHWRIPGKIQKEHIAMFPDEIPYRLIRMFSFIGDTVLDPFVGSGTTLKVAKALNRKGVGYEVNKDYKRIIENKLNSDYVILDYQKLLCKLHQLSEKGLINILYEHQKQKGIIIIENKEGKKIIIDYLLIEDFKSDIKEISHEVNIKLEENTLINYLKGDGVWNDILNYIIVINLKSHVNSEDLKISLNEIAQNYRKPIFFIKLGDFLNKSSIKNLFALRK